MRGGGIRGLTPFAWHQSHDTTFWDKSPFLSACSFDYFLSVIRMIVDFKFLGALDERTLKKMLQPRCGVKDIIRPTHRNRPTRQLPGHDFGKWMKNKLTYRILHKPASMTVNSTEREIARAFGIWTSVANLTITQVDHNDPDMEIMFAKGDHGNSHAWISYLQSAKTGVQRKALAARCYSFHLSVFRCSLVKEASQQYQKTE